MAMRLSVASHRGKLSPTSWAIRGPLLPPTTPCWSRRHHTFFQLFSHGSLHTWRTDARSALVMARAVGRVSSSGWVGAARVIADSAHCCQASILAVWLGCMRTYWNFTSSPTSNLCKGVLLGTKVAYFSLINVGRFSLPA
jgi:hypothetical protein